MRFIRKISLLGFITIGLISCDQPSEAKSESEEVEEKLSNSGEAMISKSIAPSGVIDEKEGLKLVALEEESDFPNASLELNTRTESLKSGKNTLQFSVEGYELAKQTEDQRSTLLANSKKGQHVHFILNNGPYEAHYDEEFEIQLDEGHNVILAFLSRSYHESVKEETAFVFKDVVIGEELEDFDKSAPCLIYSRPKGSYTLSESDRILVDFYLLNAKLSSSDMKVELTVDDTVFMLSNWQPYWVEGLKAGEHKFRLRLLDEEGNLVQGPFNDSGIRLVKIEE